MYFGSKTKVVPDHNTEELRKYVAKATNHKHPKLYYP